MITEAERARAGAFLARHGATELLVAGVTGAHFYGFPSPDSDLDVKGIHVSPTAELAGLAPPKETVDWSGFFEGTEFDYTSHEVGMALRLLLKGNGTMLERILSPLQLVHSADQQELVSIAEGAIARSVHRHYAGFMNRKIEDSKKVEKPTAKGLLYVYRSALTGIHLLNTGELVGDAVRLAAEYGFAHVAELVERKRTHPEKAPVDDPARWEADWPRLEQLLASARDGSPLPEQPANHARVEDFLLRLRRAHAGDRRPSPRAPATAELVDDEPAGGALLLGAGERAALWRRLEEICETHVRDLPTLPVQPAVDFAKLEAQVAELDFARPRPAAEVLERAAALLRDQQLHVPHPRYFGLFNPAPAAMGVFADALVAAFNPQLATAAHSPFATVAERHVVRALAARFGYDPRESDGTFASGGAEANHTAVACALVDRVEGFADGLAGSSAAPVFYVSREAHHSFRKAARLCGLGDEAAREVPVDRALAMDPTALEAMIRADRAAGKRPFMVVATAGTTTAGAIDPIEALRRIATAEKLWLHVDAAWGGAAALVPELSGLLEGTARSDSITFDAHKWLSVPMGAGLFLTRHTGALERAFAVQTGYMPRERAPAMPHDPYAHSMQWSRRFIGLKVLMSLAVAGWDGYAQVLRHQVAMGDLLRSELEQAGWRIVNRTPLPVVCFDDPRIDPYAVADAVAHTGQAWLSAAKLSSGAAVLRACVTSYRTRAPDVEALVALVSRARDALV
jgi:glutamate/tyrosine decarboxylase-like PLP-dependent enzyme/predicted nucleotidyltransferase